MNFEHIYYTIVRSKPVLSFFGLFFSLHILVLLLFLAELLVMAVASETFHHPHQPWVCWQRMLLARLLISLGGLQQPRMWCQLPPMPFKSLCPLLPWIDEKTYSHTVNSLHEKKRLLWSMAAAGGSWRMKVSLRWIQPISLGHNHDECVVLFTCKTWRLSPST